MNGNVLVTYASKYGATAEIARRIGEMVTRAGLRGDVISVDYVRDLSQYQAVILGGALYVGKWHKGAEKFLRVNEKALASRPVWIFSSGPTGSGDPLELVEGQRLPAALQPVVDRIHPRDVTVFHGFINPDRINPIEKWAIKSVVKKPFGDFRDWDMIAGWTNNIIDALQCLTPDSAHVMEKKADA